MTKPLPRTGIVRGMPNAEYHGGPELSASQLGDLLRSPAHFFAKNRVASQAFRHGTLFHLAALEPELFRETVIAKPNQEVRTKAGKEAMREWAKGHGVTLGASLSVQAINDAFDAAGKIYADGEEIMNAATMASQLRRSPFGEELFTLPHEVEISVFFEFETKFGKIPFRCRPDVWIPGVAIVDLKKTKDASPKEFNRSAVKFGYHRAAWIYREAMKQATGEELPFIFGCVEDYNPYAVAWYEAGEEILALGEAEVRTAAEVYATCCKSGDWPGYPQDPMTLEPPAWRKPEAPSVISEIIEDPLAESEND